jgi:alkylmercury lyase-like protein
MATTVPPVEAQKNATSQDVTSQDVLRVLNRLQELLPLKKRQMALAPPLRYVHRFILKTLGRTGRPPKQSEIAAILGSKANAVNALAVLGASDLVVLSTPAVRDKVSQRPTVPDGVEVVGAYPMTAETTPHKVVLGDHFVHAMCAVDALSISPMFEQETFGQETWIESKCHVTGTPIRIFQQGANIVEASPSREIRVGIRWQSFSTCAAHTLCTEMVFLKDAATAERWRASDPPSIDMLTIPEAIELGAAFFVPLLED